MTQHWEVSMFLVEKKKKRYEKLQNEYERKRRNERMSENQKEEVESNDLWKN